MGIETLKMDATPIKDYLLASPTGQAQVGKGTGSSDFYVRPQSSLKQIQAGGQCNDADAKFREFDRAYLAFQVQANYGNNKEEFHKAARNFFEKADNIQLPARAKGEIALAAAKKFEREDNGKEAGSKYQKAYENLFKARSPEALDRAVRNYTEAGKKAGVPLEIRSKTVIKAWGIFYGQKTCF